MISYPLVIPGPPNTPGPNKVNPKMFDAVGEFISPFEGSAQQQQNQDQHWELDLDWPEMTWEQFAPLAAFAGALHGKWGSFLWGPPLGTAPQGSALGMPVAAGTDLSGSNTLTTQAWLPNESGVLLPADYLSLLALDFASEYAIAGVSVAFELVYVTLTTLLTEAQQAALVAAGQVGFIGLTTATWLNGWLLTVNGFGATGWGHNPVTTIIGFNLAQPGSGFGGTIPFTYAYAADTGETGSASFLPRLYQYVNPNPLNTDGGGNATLDIFPAIREAPAAGTPLVLLNPQGTFRLAENRREMPTSKTKTFTFQMKSREAI